MQFKVGMCEQAAKSLWMCWESVYTYDLLRIDIYDLLHLDIVPSKAFSNEPLEAVWLKLLNHSRKKWLALIFAQPLVGGVDGATSDSGSSLDDDDDERRDAHRSQSSLDLSEHETQREDDWTKKNQNNDASADAMLSQPCASRSKCEKWTFFKKTHPKSKVNFSLSRRACDVAAVSSKEASHFRSSPCLASRLSGGCLCYFLDWDQKLDPGLFHEDLLSKEKVFNVIFFQSQVRSNYFCNQIWIVDHCILESVFKKDLANMIFCLFRSLKVIFHN